MKSKTLVISAVSAITLSLVLASSAILQPAFAHASTSLTLKDEHVDGKKIRVVLGHTNEPTYGVEPGIHDGKHNVEVLLSDSDTRLPLTGATLKVDKYYFKNAKSFEKAESVKDADEIQKGVVVGSVFGDPGHYMARQVEKPGIYGYRLYGTINYFDVAKIDIDSTVFCSSSEGDTSKFNSKGWGGGYGCTEDIRDTFFPSKGKKDGDKKASFELDINNAEIQNVALESTANEAYAMTLTDSKQPEQAANTTYAYQMLLAGLPIAAIAGFFGYKSRRKSKSEEYR